MKKFIKKFFTWISFKIIGRKETRKFLISVAHLLNYNLLQVAHYERGIGKYWEVSSVGEKNFLIDVLKRIFSNYSYEKLILFDVGANIGEYSLNLRQLFPASKIFSFEPNPAAFYFLKKSTSKFNEITIVNSAIGKKQCVLKLFTHADYPESQQASIIPGVITELQRANSVLSFDVNVIDIDSYCECNNIDRINFLKIDTEGYELEVLKGATSLIEKGKIDVIQFEFNEMNLYARIFLKDFYGLLKGYEFYRMNTDTLIPLGSYEAVNEIFLYQNIIAIKNELIFSKIKSPQS